MSKGKLVSIIIPTYNEERNVGDCLKTLESQSYQPLEILVVDDGSSDGTLGVVRSLQFSGQRFQLLRQRHLGPAKARNFASGKAKGEILVFMDADMSFSKNFIKDLVSPILDGKYKGTFSKNEYVKNWDNVWARCWSINLGLVGKRMIPEDYPDEGQDFRAILRSEFLKVGGFSDVGYTDTWSLAQKLGYKPHTVRGAEYYHNNPDSLKEVYIQARWVSKRKYKFGAFGVLITLVRSSLPLSLINGVTKSLKNNEVSFLVFKVVYDLGQFLGILEMIFKGKLSK